MSNLTEQGFIDAIANEFVKEGKMKQHIAADLALATYRIYKSDIGVKFGDEDYFWDQYAAKEVAWEYEISHWDGA